MLPLDLLVAACAIYILYRILNRQRSSLSLPPGPKGLPLVGNLFDMPKTAVWLAFHAWAKDLDTDIIHVNLAGQSVVVIDTAAAATELLEKRSSIYSGRPPMPMVNDLMGWNWDFGTMDYGDSWRQQRRVMHHGFHPGAVRRLMPHISKSSLNFLNLMIESPNNLIENLKVMAGHTILAVAYGINAKQANERYIEVVHRAVRALTEAAVPGTFLVDSLPILKHVPEWMPGAGFKTKARVWKSYTHEMLEQPFEATRKMMEDGTCPPCFTSISLEEKNTSALKTYEDDTVKTTAGALYAAGAETTVAVLTSCVLGLLCRPDVLKQAQADLDRIVNPGNFPTFEDEPSLPIITAIVKETMRWRVITPLAIPHHLSVDDVYKGYRIPAGSIIIPNAWAMLHNEDVYPNPSEFKPERFLKDGKWNPAVRDPTHAMWGFGRRICPGRFVAFPSVWVTIASLIYAFNIEKEVDEKGNYIEPTPADIVGLVKMPEAFPYRIKPRSAEFEKLVRESRDRELDN